MRRLLAVAIGLSALPGLAPPAAANIVVGESIAGVNLLDSKSKIRSKLGEPTDRHYGGTRRERWYYRSQRLLIRFNRHRAFELSTSSTRQRTADGLGPGATFAAVNRAYPGACADPLVCIVSRRRTFTRFFMRDTGARHVKRVTMTDLRYQPPPPS